MSRPAAPPHAHASASRDYERVARAIRYLERHTADQPDLVDVARHLGLSPDHLHRIFRRWAGTTPKRFLQFLTARSARQRLRASETVLDTTFGTGLSSPGRLHDLMLTVDAATPGEVGRLGEGLTIRAGGFPTPFGTAVGGVTQRGVCLLRFVDDAVDPREVVAADWPAADVVVDPSSVAEAVGPAFGGEPGALPIAIRGSNLQLQVWSALLAIPEGSVTTYGRLAAAIGRPEATRAVASAVGRNPVGYLIPCHRVLRSTGDLGGYRWGSERKRLMLGREAARRAEAEPGAAAV